MDRRMVLGAVGSGFLVGTGPAAAQLQRKPKRIGVLSAGTRERHIELGNGDAFIQAMREFGHVEGRDFVIEARFADGHYERLPELASELVQLKVDLILANPSPAIRAAREATSVIPIVFPGTGDPVGAGFAVSLSKPGGNLTGVSNNNVEISAKLLELLKTIAPATRRVAVLANPDSSSEAAMLRNIDAAASAIGVTTFLVAARTAEEIDQGVEAVRRQGGDALLIAADGLMNLHNRRIASLAARHRLPSVTQSGSYVRVGGLMSYSMGPGAWRAAASYVDKIFKGAKPGDLPIEMPRKLRLVINRKAASELGLAIPQSLLLRADEVID